MIKTYFYSHSEKNMRHDVDLDQKHLFLRDEEDLLWVDLYNFSDEEIKYVAKIFDFHPLAVEDCLSYSPRPKLDNYEDYSFFVMHALRYDEESEEEIELVQLNVFLGTNFVVTVHRQTLPVLGRIARVSLQNPQYMNKGIEFFLYSIIDGNTDDIFPIMDRIGVRIDELEDQIYEQPSKQITEEFLALKRTILTIRRAVLPMKRIFTSINAGGHPYFDIREDIKPYFLDLVDHMERITDSIESHRDLVDAALATYYSLISSRTNDTIRVLTVISTIFMPLTFLTGFFGMNVPLPYQSLSISTVVITAGLFGISGLMLLLFKNLRWL
ncbi:MAG TPA: magnesium/cobalt transporter CorA [Bacillota bacterium]|nr:magnesium/cobalt transporter CorA [Peptococcaceae bacterium MAG4]NLW38338.1 magnesium/cobalt transporter CorA [Peptococcaceae bacterium]HPU35953.1 magnesium/cobalt transporter CorA [Bacillota bacterium]HPZ42991.1 magnesium/cobalt transporter CorA [Bacillota bacterium]HQD75379.1 magnesium/cobalt transporter CorA [Bacillota bacterium]